MINGLPTDGVEHFRKNKQRLPAHAKKIARPEERGRIRAGAWKDVVVTDGCWFWTGSTNGRVGHRAYGTVHSPGRGRQLAHRVFYEMFVGPIPDGLTIDHLCRNKLCVNPMHLEPVSGEENTRRHFRERSVCKRGHALVEENIYLWRGTRHCKACRELHQRKRRSA